MRALAALLAIGILSAGCLAGPVKERGGQSDSSETTTPENPDPPRQPIRAPETQIAARDGVLRECNGFATYTEIPTALHPGETPAGWKKESPLPSTKLRYYIWECNRFSAGGFERGPFRFVIEGHTKADAPEKCRGGDYDYRNLVSFMAIDDPEIAARWATDLGIHVDVFDVQLQRSVSLEVNEWRGSFGPTRELKSDLLVRWGGLPDPVAPDIGKFFIVHGETVHRLDLMSQSGTMADAAMPLAHGTMAENTMHGRVIGPDYAGITGIYMDWEFSFELTSYGDLQCLGELA